MCSVLISEQTTTFTLYIIKCLVCSWKWRCEDDLQLADCQLQNILKNYNTEISEKETKSVSVTGEPRRELKY
jgi:hypothetical protein